MSHVEIHLWVKTSHKTVVFEVDKNNKKVWVLKKNEKDNSIYTKFKNGKFIFQILWIDDILLTSNDVNLSLEKKFCPQVSMWMILVKRHWF